MKKCLTAKDKYGNTPLILSCKNKHNDMRVTIKIVERIVSELQRVIPDNKELKKCVQSTSQTQKWSALHWAVRTANSRAVEVLTPFSNPEQVDAMKRSALSLAGSLYKEVPIVYFFSYCDCRCSRNSKKYRYQKMVAILALFKSFLVLLRI